MKILISGGAGFIGTRLALGLRARGHEVTVLDNLSPQIHGPEPEHSELFRTISGKVRFIRGSVLNRKDWLSALKAQDVVVHLAAETGTGQSMYEVERYVDVNVRGTAILLDILANRERSVSKIVVASSRAIYGEGRYHREDSYVYPLTRSERDLLEGDFDCKCPITGDSVELVATDEEAKIHPTSIYGITKQNQEQMVLTMGPVLGIDCLAFRYQNVYGPGQSLSNPYTGILSIFSTQLRQGKDINVFEDGLESRDFVYIDDAVKATIRGIESESVHEGAFNVGSGVATDVLTVARTLKAKYTSPGEIHITGNFRFGDIRHNYADLTKVQKELGFAPRVTFEQGVSKFADWVMAHEVTDNGAYQQSIKEMRAKGLFK